MNKAKLKTYAPQARKDFIAAVTARAHLLGIAEQDGQLEIAPGEKTGDLVLIAGQAWPAKVHNQRERLIQRMRKEGFAQTLEAVAYTWFNRFAALRFMEIHDYLGHGHRVLSSREGGLPEILTHATELAGALPGLKAQQIADMKLAGNQDGELYRLLLVAQCNALSNAMPFLFERIDDESELLLPGNLERTDSVVAKLVEAIPEEDWNEVEVIGWLYQFYISEKKDEVIGKVVKSEDIPAATQLFTPNWIVQYLVQNSVGRLWLMANPSSSLKSQWPYYIEPAEQTPEVQAQLDALVRARCAEGVDSGKWIVNSGGGDGGTGLSRIDRLAEGDGSCRGGVSADTTVSQRRVVQSDKSSAAGSRVDSIEHRRGASSQIDGGVSELSVDSPGVKVGGGNADSDCNSAQVCNNSRHADGAFLAAGITENAVVPANPSRVNPTDYPLSTIHYPLDPESITVLDPACGSGHILVEAYEVLKGIYLERGYQARSIPRLILEKNLYGLDIDDRAAQLAGFALLMKARADDRRLLETPVRLNVLSLQESVGMDLDGFAEHLKPHGINRTVLGSLLDSFTHAKTFGSLIQIPKVLEDGLAGLEDGVAKAIENGDVFAKASVQDLVPLVQQAKILAMKFDAVVANPPYMGGKYLTPSLKGYLKDNYAGYEKDLFSAFMLRDLSLTKESGQLGFMSPFVWMFISSYEELRHRLINFSTITSLIQLEYSGFDGATVPICTFTLGREHFKDFSSSFIRLSEFRGADLQGPKTLEAIRDHDCGWFFITKPDEFKKISGTPIVYWVSKSLFHVFETATGEVRDFAEAEGKNVTTDNSRFIRYWWEVQISGIGRLPNRWFSFAKGGPYRKWFGNEYEVVDWSPSALNHYRKEPSGRLIRQEYWYLKGITWSKITSSRPSFRVLETDQTYQEVAILFTEKNEQQLLPLLGLLNSIVAENILAAIAPTLNYQLDDICRVPRKGLSRKDEISEIVSSLVHTARSDCNSVELALKFQSFPLFRGSDGRSTTLEVGYINWVAQNRSTIADMRRLEEENNRIFIDSYSLTGELTAEVPVEQITLTVNPAYRYGGNLTEDEQWSRFRQDTMAELISYAIGCMMGRYSLDEPGLIYAHAGNVGFDATCYKSFPADADGIIPITDELWFDDDAASRIREFILAVWPAPTFEENLAWLAESLGTKGNETPDETIRRYLASSFFKDHLQTYKKRPIYWLFSSGKQGAFQALVYLHRYHEGTLARMRAEYVVPLTGKMQSRIEMLETDKDAASSTAARNKLAKQIESLKKKHVELLAYDEKLRHFADMRITLDLDDGVKVNYGKFGDLLAEVKAVTGGVGDE